MLNAADLECWRCCQWRSALPGTRWCRDDRKLAPARSPNQQAALYISMRKQVGLAERTTTMLSYLIVSGLCMLLLLHTVCKVWQNALETHCAADNFDKTRDFAAPRTASS